jgi:DNA-binding response OmpR family regulator
VPDVLVVTDSERVFDTISAAIEEPEVRLRWARSGTAVVASLQESPADLVVSDLQVGTMGGYAIAMDLALEAGAGRLPRVPVLLLLDRRADVFLAKRTGVDGWVLKPLDPLRLWAATRALLSGQPYHDPTWRPSSDDVQAA